MQQRILEQRRTMAQHAHQQPMGHLQRRTQQHGQALRIRLVGRLVLDDLVEVTQSPSQQSAIVAGQLLDQRHQFGLLLGDLGQ